MRYHRKETPTTADENFQLLPQKDRLAITKLYALLRRSDALDTRHTARARDANLEQRPVLRAGTGTKLQRWHLATETVRRR
jgi:hypothetical protein